MLVNFTATKTNLSGCRCGSVGRAVASNTCGLNQSLVYTKPSVHQMEASSHLNYPRSRTHKKVPKIPYSNVDTLQKWTPTWELNVIYFPVETFRLLKNDYCIWGKYGLQNSFRSYWRLQRARVFIWTKWQLIKWHFTNLVDYGAEVKLIKHFTIVIYDSIVVLTRKLPILRL